MNVLAGMKSDTGTANRFCKGPLIDGKGHLLYIFSDGFNLRPSQNIHFSRVSVLQPVWLESQ